MKIKHLLTLAILLAAIAVLGCKNSGSGSSAKEENFDKDASYALGMSIGAGLKENLDMDGIVPNIDEFMKGFRDSLTGGNMRFDVFQAIEIINSAFNTMSEAQNAEAIETENAFLAQNSQKSGVITTASGLQYEIITETNGPKPSMDDTVLVHYEGRLLDGTVFDSSFERGYPEEFPVGIVIQGWREGLQLMSVGSKYKLYIPSNLGYGTSDYGPIPGYSVLIFDVELLDILENESFN